MKGDVFSNIAIDFECQGSSTTTLSISVPLAKSLRCNVILNAPLWFMISMESIQRLGHPTACNTCCATSSVVVSLSCAYFMTTVCCTPGGLLRRKRAAFRNNSCKPAACNEQTNSATKQLNLS